MTANNSANMPVILKALAVLVNGQGCVWAFSGMTKHAHAIWFLSVKYAEDVKFSCACRSSSRR